MLLNPSRLSQKRVRLPLHLHAEEMIPTLLTSNIYIGVCLPTALTLTRLWLDAMFEVLLIVRIYTRVAHQGIVSFRLL